jgi:2-iminobutanoate/2-iminopropanoate deaminase
MSKKQIVTDKAFTPVYAYSQGIVANGFVYTSGFGPHDPKTGEIIGDSIEEQTVATLANVSAVLAGEGLDLSDVVKATVHLADLRSDFPGFDSVYSAKMPAPFPVRTTVGSVLAGIKVEIDVVAAVRQ